MCTRHSDRRKQREKWIGKISFAFLNKLSLPSDFIIHTLWLSLQEICYFHTQGIVTNVVNTAVPTRSYGSQRVFSTLGYALLNFLTGVIIDSYHPTGMSSYTACFYVYLPCILGVIPCGILLLGKVLMSLILCFFLNFICYHLLPGLYEGWTRNLSDRLKVVREKKSEKSDGLVLRLNWINPWKYHLGHVSLE